MDAEQIQKIAKALSDPRRREILEIIAHSENQPGFNCTAIVEQVSISQPTVSHHIKELANAGLIETQTEGHCSRITVRRDVMNSYLEYLSRSLNLPGAKNSE